MKATQVALFIGALIAGITSMGCWVLTHADAAVTREEGPTVVLIMLLGLAVSLALLVCAGVLYRERPATPRICFLIGLCGLLVMAFFIITSRGAIVQFGAFPKSFLARSAC